MSKSAKDASNLRKPQKPLLRRQPPLAIFILVSFLVSNQDSPSELALKYTLLLCDAVDERQDSTLCIHSATLVGEGRLFGFPDFGHF